MLFPGGRLLFLKFSAFALYKRRIFIQHREQLIFKICVGYIFLSEKITICVGLRPCGLFPISSLSCVWCHLFSLAFVQPCWRDFLGVASHDARRHYLTANSLYSGSYIIPTPCSAGSMSLGYSIGVAL